MMARDNLYAELMEDLHPNRPRVDLELTALSVDELAVMGVISSVEYITTE